jgi:thymidylate synthase (FAD)
MHFFDLRKNMKAQWEAREFATKVLSEAKEWAPLTFDGYEQYINNNSLRAP